MNGYNGEVMEKNIHYVVDLNVEKEGEEEGESVEDEEGEGREKKGVDAVEGRIENMREELEEKKKKEGVIHYTSTV